MKNFVIVSIMLLLCSCVAMVRTSTTSPIQRNSKPVGSINFVIDAYRNGSVAITATASDGEIYKGNAIGETDDTVVNNGDSVECDNNHQNCGVVNHGTSVDTEYTGTWNAKLTGNHGNSMNCTFASPALQISIIYGANGSCQISDGRVVPINISGPITNFDKDGKVMK